MSESPRKVIIYQMMTRLFGNKVTTNKKYGSIEENGVGKFNDITPEALKAIRELGVTHIWYTGVIEHATLTDYSAYGIPGDDADVVKGRAGSPYAIKDYYDVSPDLAVDVRNRMGEFESLVTRTHEHGMKVIIDFVPNHVARAYKSDARPPGVKDLGEDDNPAVAFDPNNNFYYLPGQSFTPPPAPADFSHPTLDGKFEEVPAKATGNDEFVAAPGPHSWYETVKLNYGVDIINDRRTYFDPVPDTWFKMRDILRFWVGKGVDGFRCDMAEMVPVEFWEWIIPQLRATNPSIIFIAEIYNVSQYRTYLDRGKFDYLYDKVQLYDTLRVLTEGQRSTSDVAKVRESLADISKHMLHFMENHDEQRIASRFFAGGPWRGIPPFVVSATIDSGPVMIYFGQEVGETGEGAEGFQGDDGRTTIFDYWGVPEHQKWMNGGKFDGALLSEEQRQLRRFYSELLDFIAANPAITSGEYADLTPYISPEDASHKVHAFLRYHENERLIVITSYNDHDLEATFTIPPDLLRAMGLSTDEVYIARDMLWREIEVGLDQKSSFSLKIKPFSSYILKIK